MYTIYRTKKFVKSLKRIKSGVGGLKIIKEVERAVEILSEGKNLPANYNNHELKDEYLGYSECHIRGDLLLLYKVDKNKLILVLVEIGSHSYFF
jgi:mRNA interferase YafQ